MKKKMISGLLVGLFIGTLGFCTVSEAIDSSENDQMKMYEMRQHRKSRMNGRNALERRIEADELTKEEAAELQKKREEATDYSYDRKGAIIRTHMKGGSQKYQEKMSNSCWESSWKVE